ncbi:MAG TPA: patatin-like phospholipase family protein, partial [Nitrolancea sp.]|nr:patatin-like phospholipase family protein [Nitrolancea sp.]
MAKTRIAFVLSGGVSGGSYIAGALDEILRALKSSDQFEVDIISGASAGATNAALIAHRLCYRDGET